MARMLRIQFPGAIYHIVNRGNRREAIFRDDTDRSTFLRTLGEACAKTDCQVHAFCLMPDHFHLVLETAKPNLTAGMKWFLGTYTARFNRRHELNGHLFAGRFKAQLVENDGGYLRTACDYVHLNPVRARLLTADAPVRTYTSSSLPYYLQPADRRPAWLRTDRLLGEYGIQRDDAAGWRQLERDLEAQRGQHGPEAFAAVRQGWCLGSEPFRRELLGRIASAGDTSKDRSGRQQQEVAETKAEQIVDEELKKALWTEAELLSRRKGAREKLAIAVRLRAETTVTLEWIARRLHMGTRQHLNHLLYWQRRGERDGATPRKPQPAPPAASAASAVPTGGSPGTATSDLPKSGSVPKGTAPLRKLRNRVFNKPRSTRAAPANTWSDPTKEATPIESGHETTILSSDPLGFDVRFD